jgi:hypothetical protein
MSDPNISDEEFWRRVYEDSGFGEEQELIGNEYEDQEIGFESGIIDQPPCLECGTVGACGYDEVGRPWIHCVVDREDN